MNELILSEKTIKIAQATGVTLAIILEIVIIIGISFFIFKRIYKWLIKNNYIKPKEKKDE